MIVQESDLLLAALDRRLQVDRVATVAPVAADTLASDDHARALASPGVPSGSSPTDALAPGRVVVASIVALLGDDRVLADVDTLRIDMAWPSSTSALRAGQDLRLRVLAQRPLTLESVDGVDARESTTERSDDDATRWSSDARRLQSTVATTETGASRAGPIRFDAPILLPDPAPQPAAHAMPLTDAATTPLRTQDPTTSPVPFAPLVLAGPAWPGQPLELVVRRERADEQFDNPVLDQWCGEIVIDLPALGRVAGHLAFSMQGLRIRLEADDETTVAAMTAASASLANALAADDLRVSAVSVGLLTADTAHG